MVLNEETGDAGRVTVQRMIPATLRYRQGPPTLIVGGLFIWQGGYCIAYLFACKKRDSVDAEKQTNGSRKIDTTAVWKHRHRNHRPPARLLWKTGPLGIPGIRKDRANVLETRPGGQIFRQNDILFPAQGLDEFARLRSVGCKNVRGNMKHASH